MLLRHLPIILMFYAHSPRRFSPSERKMVFAAMLQQVLTSAQSRGPLAGALFWNAITSHSGSAVMYEDGYNVLLVNIQFV